ncbi:MAG: sugar nucleotide-binding protein [Oscillibacter sp.]|nr:sugar nucleotide-binding protein [Oscillibacter sp.]
MKKVLLLGSSGLVGRSMEKALREEYRVIPAAGHKKPEGGYCLPAEEPEKLLEVLEREEPEIVISTIRGDYQAQMRFHETLADWLAGKEKRLLYVSTANVFDGNLSRPWTEEDPPEAESEYGVFKRECEAMLGERLGDQLIIFRLAAVWDKDCPRARQLKLHSRSGEAHHVWRGDAVNITLAGQVGDYAKYVLGHDLRGIFHVGTTDVADHFAFEKLACEALGIAPPEFEMEEVVPQAYQAVIPARREIPAELQLTVAQVLEALRSGLR